MPRLTEKDKRLLVSYQFHRGQVGYEQVECEDCSKKVGGQRQMWRISFGEETIHIPYCVPCALKYCNRIETFDAKNYEELST